MMKGTSLSLVLTGLICINIWSCVKQDPLANNCEAIQQVKIISDKTSYLVGEPILLHTNLVPPIALWNWTLGDNPNQISGDTTLFIYYANKSDQGWYYLSVSYPDCASHNDSIFIQVTNNPVAPVCSPANNTVIFSALSNFSFPTTSLNVDPNYNSKLLSGTDAYGNPEFNIYFNPYWNYKEPEDGEYNIYNVIDFTGSDPYALYMNTLYSNILFQAGQGKAYVTHVNGKLRVTFCTITLTGSNGGTAFTTTATGAITAP